MKTLVFFGDSLLKGFYKEMCEEIERETEYDIYNCAVGGWNTNDGIKKAGYISSLKPDAIIFSFGTNDAAPWKKIDPDTYTLNLRKIFQTFGSGEKYILLPPPLSEYMLPPNENQRNNILQKQYSEIARNEAADHDVKVIDTWKLFLPLLDASTEYQEDGIHFNDLGDEMLVKEIIRVLNDKN